jgi:hypothetical protein
MKRSTMLLAALLAAVPLTMVAQGSDSALPYFPPPERFKGVDPCWFDKTYAPALVSDNDGVVESGIAQSVNAKIAMPAGEFNKIRTALGSLAVCGRTPSLRYKAYLAGLVFENPSLFEGTDVRRFDSSEQLFASLSDRLQKVLIGSIDRKYVRER